MNNKVQIFGAGLAGLIAGNVFRNSEEIAIFEGQKNLPNNHSALLRFRTDAASKATGIEFKKVKVKKNVFTFNELRTFATIADENKYSQKVTGKILSRSIGNLESVERYIAPLNFISQMSRCCKIYYNTYLDMEKIEYNKKNGIATISTIPMNKLMDIVGWEKPEFNYQTIYTITCDIITDCDVYQTIYDCDFNSKIYRISITGKKLIIELTEQFNPENVDYNALADLCFVALEIFGIKTDVTMCELKKLEYGKLSPIDDLARKRFIIEMTDKYGIYSLGRFATWRQILIDDIVDDALIIKKLIESKDEYYKKLNY